MKILILASNLSNEAGGYSESSFLLRDKLDKIKKNKAFLFGFWKSNILRVNHKMTDKINIFSSGFINKFPFSISYFRKIEKINPDIIDVQGLWSSCTIFNLLYNLFHPTPYIVTPRGMLEKWAMERSYLKKRIFYYLFEKLHLKKAKCLRATSMLEVKTFKNLGFANPIINIPNSIKIPVIKKKKLPKNKKKFRLLFLSRIHPKKGISDLLYAWKEIQGLYPNWELVICGYDELKYKKKMINLAASLKLERVIWKNFVLGKERDKLYRSSDLFILLSYSENFGLVIAEALSYQIPVITTINTPWIELNKNKCGWGIDLKKNQIVKTLNTAMNISRKQKFEMGKRGRKWMLKEFSEKSIGIKMDKVYKWIKNKGPKPKDIILN